MSSSRRKIADASPPEEVVEQPYHLKYRPAVLKEITGHKEIVASIRSALKEKSRQHTYFLFGPGGTGKTTLARIMAAEFGCAPANIIEVDAASTSGIDDMRALMTGIRYNGFGDSPNKAFIIDEAQGLSAAAQDSLLKATEEPPSHVYFFFCSTNPGKIKPALLTRGPVYVLQSVRFDDLMDLLEFVVVEEALDTPERVLQVVARACNGSPRQALVMLAMVKDCREIEEAEVLLEGVGETPEVIDLCRAMVKGTLKWADVQKLLVPLADMPAENIRILVTHYLIAVLKGCKEREAPRLLDMLAAFSKPGPQSDKLGPIFLAFGEFVDFGR